MTSEVNMDTLTSDLTQIVESVFNTMLGLDVTASEVPWHPDVDRLTAAVHISGDWNGAVLIECTHHQACGFAGRFLSMDPPETVDDDTRDVLGELTNMIGGNLKSILPAGTGLSIPSVVDGSDYSVRVCGASVRERLTFECCAGPFWITLLTTEQKP